MHPTPKTPRNSPIAGVLLTNADLDHVLGLYLLREGNSVSLHATESVFGVLENDLRLIDVLKASCHVEHHVPSADSFRPLLMEKSQSSGLRYRALRLSDRLPPYASGAPSPGEAQSVAYEIIDERTQGRLLIAPDVASMTPELLAAMNEADAVLFDGTFWSNEELQNMTGKVRTAEDMGHLTIRDGSLGVLAGLKARTKIYLHINNTNPILDPQSTERAEVERAGVVVGHDGLDFEL